MTATTRAQLLSRGIRLEYLTVGWNIAEGLIAVGFGVDSFVETISGAILLMAPAGGGGRRC